MDINEDDAVPSYLLQRYRYQVDAGQFRGSIDEFLRLNWLVWKTQHTGEREWSLTRWLYEEKKRRG